MNMDDIKLFLNKDDVIDSDEVISAYSLYEILNEFFYEFRNIRYGYSSLTSMMNNEYSFRDRFKRKDVGNAWFKRISVTKFDDKMIDLLIVVNPFHKKDNDGKGNIYFHLIKDRITGNIYFNGKELCNKIFDKFYPEIIRIFDVSVKYADIFMLDRREFPIYYQEFSLNDVRTLIEYNNFGSVYYHFINNYIFDKETFDFIKSNDMDILRKMPVSVSKLDTISGHIVNEHMKKVRKLGN